jgi:hypothetical protein
MIVPDCGVESCNGTLYALLSVYYLVLKVAVLHNMKTSISWDIKQCSPLKAGSERYMSPPSSEPHNKPVHSELLVTDPRGVS